MAIQPVDFVLTDADGVEHSYTCTPHRSSEGTALCLRLLRMAGEPLGRIASSNLGKLFELFQGGALDLDGDAGELLEALERLELDLGEIVADLQLAIASAGDEKFFRAILKNTFRDGQPLAKDSAYEAAYVANYMEQLRAVWEVIKINRFLPFLGIS